MNVTKQSGTEPGLVLDEKDLALINRWARKELAPDDVYIFGVRLCDNDIDRDGERFPVQTLQQLADLFVGKTGVFDHLWSAHGQTARIYRTELVYDQTLTTATGEPYCFLKAYAYMLQTEDNLSLIAEIDGGIKKEVSVGCAVSRKVCSICGGVPGECGHVPGSLYDGKLCCADLLDATDAYEWSFVAVPAQRNAGVIKSFRQEDNLDELRAQAALGRRYLASLRQEVARLGGMVGNGPDASVLLSVTNKLGESELLALKNAYESKLREKYPARPQLTYSHPQVSNQDDGPFRI